LLAACAAIPPTEEAQYARAPLYEQRFAHLSQVDDWALEGRLAINDSNDGGSGQLRWRQRDGSSRMDFHGALGRGAWRLQADPQGAELEFADGRIHRAGSVDALVRAEVGWQVPVESLAWWIRGLAAPGPFQRRVLDEEGRLSELHQDGWNIEFGRYGQVGEVTMPMRMTARQDERTVKLAVRKWQLATPDESD
jgi:outer membrane lipoprotein LolB